MEELELTYLAKYIPKGLFESPSKKIIDRYIPLEKEHPTIRLRKTEDKLELTKKEPIKREDASHQLEQTIVLAQEEYEALSKVPAKVAVKTRYYYLFDNKTIEIDVFEEKLKGLILADVEFKDKKEKEKFRAPKFCLADVTQEDFAAGGMLAGKSFQDIEKKLKTFGYSAF
jgi:CYTH domain-containing protein